MLAEIFVLRWEAELRALETAVEARQPEFVPFRPGPLSACVAADMQKWKPQRTAAFHA